MNISLWRKFWTGTFAGYAIALAATAIALVVRAKAAGAARRVPSTARRDRSVPLFLRVFFFFEGIATSCSARAWTAQVLQRVFRPHLFSGRNSW
jgi:hypothetical protein